MDAASLILCLVGFLSVLGLAASVAGVDSRDGFDVREASDRLGGSIRPVLR